MRSATLRQAAILLGGLVARLAPGTRDTPKQVVTVGDRPFLGWQLRELSRFGVEEAVLLTGHLAEEVRADEVRASMAMIAAALPRPLRVVVRDVPVRAGSGGALHVARDLLDPRFLLCNGDCWFDCNLAGVLADARRDGSEVVGRLVVRQVEDGAQHGVVTLREDVVTGFAERGDSGGGLTQAGICLLDRRVLDVVTPHCSLERDVLPALAARGALRATMGRGPFIDIGVPEDLAWAQTEIPRLMHRPALFLDRDGTINVDHGYVGDRARFDWIPGARAAVAAATEAGWHVFVVTNQAGVARGHYDEAAVLDLHRWMTDEIRTAGGTIDDIRYCPHHPEFGPQAPPERADWRKPGPGMIRDLLHAWAVDPACSVLVGDRDTDMAAAAAAGVTGHLFGGGDLETFVRPLLAARCDHRAALRAAAAGRDTGRASSIRASSRVKTERQS